MSNQQPAQIIAKPSQRVEEERARRRRREDVTEGRLRNLAIDGDLDPRYEYRWINDRKGRVFNLTQRDDWDVVTNESMGRGDKDRAVGSGVERVAGLSDGTKCILVRKLKEYYVADKAKEQGAVDETVAAMKRGETKGPDGIRETDPGKSYVPSGGIHIQDGRRG